MSSSSWFTQYRPARLSELHLESVRVALQRLVSGETFPHALLFAGPKGTGKTSSARILAAMLNDAQNSAAVEHLFFGGPKPKKPSLQDPDMSNELVARIRSGQSLVVTELDAASHRGIDDVRALKERLALPPQEGRVAVYILDEAHMLTNEAFNALLKVLEEPPAHVVFILATTERHKIPDTIASRCAVVPFQLATPAELLLALKPIVIAEKLELESDQILTEVAAAAAGSFRDAVKLLEQSAGSGRRITLQTVQQVLRRSFTQQLPTLVQAVIDKEPQKVVSIINTIRSEQPNDVVVTRGLVEYLHQQLLAGLGVTEDAEAVVPHPVSHFLLKELQTIDFSQSHLPLLSLELKLLDLVFRAQAKSGNTPPAQNRGGAKKSSSVSTPVLVSSPVPDEVGTSPISPEPSLVAPLSPGNGQTVIDRWAEFLDLVAVANAGIQALLRSAKPLSGESGKATIAVFYSFHQEQLGQPRHRAILEDCAGSLAGGHVVFEVQLLEPVVDATVTAAPDPTSELLNLAKSTLV